MKSRLLTKGFLLSLSYHYYPAQNRILRLYLESGKPFEKAKQLIPLVFKAKKTEAFIDAISRSITLNDREKRLIHAEMYCKRAFYEKAWESIKSMTTTDQDLFALKEKVLFHIKNVHDYLLLREEFEGNSTLTDEQKIELIFYASIKLDWSVRNKLISVLGLEGYAHNKSVYNPVPNQDEDQFLSLAKLLQKHELDIHKYKEFIQAAHKVVEQNPNVFLPANTFLEDLLDAEKDMERGNGSSAFDKLMVAYDKGERSLYLKKQLLTILEHCILDDHNQTRLGRLINNGFLDIMSNDFLDVLKKQESYVSLYRFVNIEKVTIEGFHSFIKKVNESTLNHKKMIDSLIQLFYRYDYELPLREDTFKLVEEIYTPTSFYTVVKGKWLIDHGKETELHKIIEVTDKKYWVYMQLIDYAYEKERFGLALRLANKALTLRSYDPFLLRKLTSIHHRIGNIREKLVYLRKLRWILFGAFHTEYRIAKDEVHLDENLWTWNGPSDRIRGEAGVLHVLNKSLPEINGYTIRSKEIVQHQQKLGIEPMVVTKLGWPARPKIPSQGYELINGVKHYRLYTPKNKSRLNVVPLTNYFNDYADEFFALLKKVKPKVVHAASNFQNALPALAVAKKAGIPTVYEVRGLWQDSTASKIPEFDESGRYYMQEKYEIYCCEIADRVVAIGDSLADHLVNLGVERKKIDIVPNGVDAQVFSPQEKNETLIQKYQLENKTVYGFIGSITKYEGLSDLFRAFALLEKEKPNIHFLLVGDGPALPQLRELVEKLNISHIVSFVGRVPHTEVKDYYSVIEIFPFPRINAKVCRLVTPLKPFEVMAMGKLALVSHIPALNEMVIQEETGLMFEAENISSLKACLAKATEYQEIGKASRAWVEKNRDWSILSKRYLEVYDKLKK